MEVYERGRRLRFTAADFIAEGGQGRLYARGDRVYKIYLDPAQLPPPAKLQALRALDHPAIVRPLDLIEDRAQRPVGFAMRRVQQAVPLARLITTSFRDAHGIEPRRINALVEAMRQTLMYIHRQGCLQVDGNEFNYLVDTRGWQRPYFIDVDSFQAPGFPATAIMPSIRDYHSAEFSEASDWYAFAIVACQLFIGIHPFKGRHPDFAPDDPAFNGLANGLLEARMRAHVSVFNAAVRCPKSVRDFGYIPPAYRHWFEAVFERGERSPAPECGAGDAPVVALQRSLVPAPAAQQEILLTLHDTYPAPVRRYEVHNGTPMIWAGQRLFVGRREYTVAPDTLGIVLLADRRPLFLRIRAGLVEGLMETPQGVAVQTTTLEAEQILISHNTVYCLAGERFTELRVHALGAGFWLAPGATRKVMPHARSLFDGLLVQQVLGRTHLVLPYAPGACAVVQVPELDRYRILEARFRAGVVECAVATRRGRQDHLRLRFSSDYRRYDYECRTAVDTIPNFAVLDGGVLVSLPSDGRLELRRAQPDDSLYRALDDPRISAALRLVNDGGRLSAYDGAQVYRLQMRA